MRDYGKANQAEAVIRSLIMRQKTVFSPEDIMERAAGSRELSELGLTKEETERAVSKELERLFNNRIVARMDGKLIVSARRMAPPPKFRR